MREDITSFNKDSSEDYPFNVDMAGISYCDGTYKIERKNSSLYCFEYILKGRGTLIINNDTYNPREGDIYIVTKGSDHKYFSDKDDPWTKIWFNITGTLIDHLMQIYNLQNIHYIKNTDIKELFFKFLEIVKSASLSKKEIFNLTAIIFHEIIIKINSQVQDKGESFNTTALKLKEYIDNHIVNNISICELSNLIYKSQSQTIRIYKKEFGITPYEYLLQQKIATAKSLLLNTHLQITEIAYRLSFSDEHYFSNYFKSKVGVSPLKFREGVAK